MKVLIITISLLILNQTIKAQGLIFDATEFAKREKIEETRAELPDSASLKKYTPLLYPQIGSTCVAFSFAHARTILYAKKLNWTDKQKITTLSFSPFFIYYRNKTSGDLGCKSGLNIEVAAKDVLKNGIAPIVDVEYPDYYPFSGTALCIDKKGDTYPPAMASDLKSAQNFKIDALYAVTSIAEIKTALFNGMPVILCLYLPTSFNTVKGDLWVPQSTDKISKLNGHALIAVGYDENKYGGAIELMNSWGEKWGNKGFIWVKYKDYLKWFLGGYALYVDNSINAKSTSISEFIPAKAKIEKMTMKLNVDSGKEKTSFNNSEFIKPFLNLENNKK